jgi:uncharacterized membrane protein
VIDIIPNWHPVFVHFTIALLPIAALLYTASALTPRNAVSPYLLAAARIDLGIGILLTLVTILAGVNALAHSEFHNTAQIAAAHVHRRAAIATGITWLILALWDARAALKARRPQTLFVLLLLAAVVPVAATGWLGAELVDRHAVGVQQ